MVTGGRHAYVAWWLWALDLDARRRDIRVTPCDLEPDLFWSDDLAEQGIASTLCRTSCALQGACAAHALHAREPFGVWGGLTEADRGLLTLAGEPLPDDRSVIDSGPVRAALLESGLARETVAKLVTGQVSRTTILDLFAGRKPRITGKTARLVMAALEGQGVVPESLTA